MITLSTSTWLAHDTCVQNGKFNTKKCLDDLKAAGFSYVDANLWMLSKHGMPLEADNYLDWAHETKEYADKLGLAFRQAHGQTLSGKEWDDLSFADYDYVWQMNYRCIEAAKILGAEWMVMHPNNLPHDPLYSRQKALDRNLEYLAPYLEFAKGQGIGIAVENMVDFGGRRRRYCGGDAYELVELVDAINDPICGMCIDIGHANNSGIYAPDFIRLAGKRLKCLHVNDNLADKDSHLPPCFGTVNWKDTMAALREIGYDGDFSFELGSQRFIEELRPTWYRFVYNLGMDLLGL